LTDINKNWHCYYTGCFVDKAALKWTYVVRVRLILREQRGTFSRELAFRKKKHELAVQGLQKWWVNRYGGSRMSPRAILDSKLVSLTNTSHAFPVVQSVSHHQYRIYAQRFLSH
jgi:hypothetical protein